MHADVTHNFKTTACIFNYILNHVFLINADGP